MAGRSTDFRQSLLLPENAEFTSYHGYIEANGVQYFIRVSYNPARKKKRKRNAQFNFLVECDPKLQQILARVTDTVKQRLQSCPDIEIFISELCDIMTRVLSSQDPGSKLPSRVGSCANLGGLPPPDFYPLLVAEISAMGWHMLTDLDSSLSRLSLTCSDEMSRHHTFTVSLSPSYPTEVPTLEADLPFPLELQWGPGFGLVNVVNQFRESLAKYQGMWDTLDDLDGYCWVLEPELRGGSRSRAGTHRRIAIGRHASLSFRVSPEDPRGVPQDLRFLGADAVVGVLKERLNTKLVHWKRGDLLRVNLERVLELEFPRRTSATGTGADGKSTNTEDYSAECGICYSFRLVPPEKAGPDTAGRNGDETNDAPEAGVIPDRVCDNRLCCRPYHRQCLYEWLRPLPSSRQSFDMIYGSCPYCMDPISVKAAIGAPM